LSRPNGDRPSLPPPSQLRRYLREITASGSAGTIGKQTTWHERHAEKRLARVDDQAEGNPWRDLLNNSGHGESL
jgi:hypothetical protein